MQVPTHLVPAACGAGHASVVEVLCSLPTIDVNFKDCEGECPLLAACAEGHTAVVEVGGVLAIVLLLVA